MEQAFRFCNVGDVSGLEDRVDMLIGGPVIWVARILESNFREKLHIIT